MSIFRKHRQEQAPAPVLVRTRRSHKVVAEWSDEKAVYEYVLYKRVKRYYSDGTAEYVSDGFRRHGFDIRWILTSSNGWYIAGEGDKKWARETADHYDIKITGYNRK